MHETRIGFIGGGNMGRALIGGLVAQGLPPALIRVADADPAQLARVRRDSGVQTCTDNLAAARDVDAVVLAVKPQHLREAAQSIAPALEERVTLVISIAAGVRTDALERWLGAGQSIVRAMPNTPALLGRGASGLFANAHVRADQRELAESILRAVGTVVWVEEEVLLDVVTAVSGSGPAYFFLLVEALEAAAIELGLPPADARELVHATASGAAEMVRAGGDAARLREQVTSPGGTTEQALRVLRERAFEGAMRAAVKAAARRAAELADEFGGQA